LDFDRYTIDLPDSDNAKVRYQSANERTFWELLNPDLTNERDVRNLKE